MVRSKFASMLRPTERREALRRYLLNVIYSANGEHGLQVRVNSYDGVVILHFVFELWIDVQEDLELTLPETGAASIIGLKRGWKVRRTLVSRYLSMSRRIS